VRRPAAGGPRRAAQRIGGGLLGAAIAVARAESLDVLRQQTLPCRAAGMD